MNMQSAHPDRPNSAAPQPQRDIRQVEQSRVETHADGHTTIHLPSNHVLGFRPTPDSGGEAAMHVAAAVDTLHKAEAHAKRSGGVSRQESSAYLEALSLSSTNIASFERAVAKAERELYTPPKPDLVEAILDVEIRNDARVRRGTDSRGIAFRAIQDDERVLMAIVRSPIPLPYYSQIAAVVWRSHVAQRQPEKVAAIEKQRQSIEWARSIIDTATRFVRLLPTKHSDG